MNVSLAVQEVKLRCLQREPGAVYQVRITAKSKELDWGMTLETLG